MDAIGRSISKTITISMIMIGMLRKQNNTITEVCTIWEYVTLIKKFGLNIKQYRKN